LRVSTKVETRGLSDYLKVIRRQEGWFDRLDRRSNRGF